MTAGTAGRTDLGAAAGRALENRVRRRAARLGLALRKRPARYAGTDDRGGYRLADPVRDRVVLGEKYGFSLDEVGQYLDVVEEEIAEVRARENAERRFGRRETLATAR